MLECPRKAFMPPPATPMLPSSSWIIAPVRRICAPVVCCVQPSAYRMVATRPDSAVEASCSQTCRNLAWGVPQMLSTFSGV
ncbi:hypothetical protein D3C78_1802340 [compost metagenome]